MFGFLKNILRKPRETAVEQQEVSPDAQGSALSAYMPAASQAAHNRPTRPASHSAGKGVEVSLQSIIESLPLELQPRIRQREVGELMISIALEKVLAQLSRGSVRMSFGELRHAAPGVFSSEDDRDKVMVTLPLSEIVPRLNPALIQRRRIQKQIEVPPEIGSPFDSYGQGLIFSVGPTKSEAEPAAPALPPSRKTVSTSADANGTGRLSYALAPTPPEAPAAPAAPARVSISSAPTPPPPAALPPEDSLPPSPITMKPAANKPIPFLKATKPPQAPPPAKPPVAEAKPVMPAPIPMSPTPIPMSNKGPTLTPRVQPVRPVNGVHPPVAPVPATPAVQAIAAIPMTPPAPEPVLEEVPAVAEAPAVVPLPAPAPVPAKPAGEPLIVPLTSLAEAWPEEIRKEILQFKLVDAKVGLPVDAVEQALKQGRIVFSWKTLRSWMRPPQSQTVSNHDSVVLELPLQLVAPLFLERQRQSSKPQQKVSVDEDIPNLFFGFPQPDAPVGAGATAEDTNFYVWDDRSDTAMVDRSAEKRPTPGTKFVAKYATPNEIVSRAAAMEGVAGAIIALPDGLMVASRLSPDVNGDTLAAFLPHIFGKVSQCTKELRMGELNNLNFTVGNVPWKIFRVNAIFFAAFGTVGKSLPTAQLAALAGDLNHKPK